MLKVVFGIAAVIILALFGVSFYAGMFDALVLTREPRGPYTLLYREHRGAYEGIRLVINDVYHYSRDTLNTGSKIGFAIFYDKPTDTKNDTLRSIAGVLVDSCTSVRPPYKTGVFEQSDAVVGRYYLRSFFSYTMGGYKFYEKLPRFLTDKNIHQTGPIVELYNSAERTILYIAPVQRTTSPVPPFTKK